MITRAARQDVFRHRPRLSLAGRFHDPDRPWVIAVRASSGPIGVCVRVDDLVVLRATLTGFSSDGPAGTRRDRCPRYRAPAATDWARHRRVSEAASAGGRGSRGRRRAFVARITVTWPWRLSDACRGSLPRVPARADRRPTSHHPSPATIASSFAKRATRPHRPAGRGPRR